MANYQRNINRGYMKLDDWIKAMELFQLISKLIIKEDKTPYKLKNQLLDATQSISANIAEGYCSRHLNEYIQYLYIALGSAGETLTRSLGLKAAGYLSKNQFSKINDLHYEVENKLLALVKALECKRTKNEWHDRISEPELTKFHKDFDND